MEIKSILKTARDPIWQAVGVLISVIALFLATSTPSAPNGEVAIIRTQSISFSDYLLPSNIIKLNLAKSVKDMDGARVDYYSIINKGPKPILPSDFIAPLSIDTPSDGGILLVDSCAQPSQGSQKQTSSSSSSSSCKPGSFVTTTWSEQENQWIQERALLNPDELFCVVVIQKAGAQNLHWSGRIAGSKIAHYANFEEYENSLEKKLPYYFETSIHLEGLAAYWFAILQVSGLYSTLLLARQAKWPSSAGALWPTIVATLLATSTAEIMVDIFINDNRTRLSPVVWPLLFGHAALIVLLLVRALKVRLGKGLIP